MFALLGVIVLGIGINLIIDSYRVRGVTICLCPASPAECPCAGTPPQFSYAFDMGLLWPAPFVTAFGAALTAAGTAWTFGRGLPQFEPASPPA